MSEVDQSADTSDPKLTPTEGALKAKTAILENAKPNENKPGQYDVTQATYVSVAKDAGLDKSTLDSVQAFQNDYLNGLVMAAGDLTAKAVTDAKKAGKNDLSDISATVSSPMSAGRAKATVKSESTFRNPATGKPVTSIGTTSIHLKAPAAALKSGYAGAKDLVTSARQD